MDGPRGSLVIGLLFFISGQLAFIAGALTGGTGFSLAGVVMSVFFVLAVVRVLVELFREGQASADADAAARRPQGARGAETPAATGSIVVSGSEGGAARLDPVKRRPAQG